MKKLLLCGVAIAALAPAAPAAAKAKPMRPCATVGLASIVKDIRKHGPSCQDVRVAIRSVEAHASACKPYREATLAPFRECAVQPVLSTGQRAFTCRSAYLAQGDNKRWWRTTCRSAQGDRLTWLRDGNHLP